MILLGISGKKRSGKNTVAKIIQSLTPLKCQEFAFADELKNEVARLCKVSRHDIDKSKNLYRHLLQAWGIYVREIRGDDWWIKIVVNAILKSNCDIALVTDVRFLNEASSLQQAGAILIRVVRDGSDGDSHPSEIDLDTYKFDIWIDNSGTLDTLTSHVREVLKQQKILLK